MCGYSKADGTGSKTRLDRAAGRPTRIPLFKSRYLHTADIDHVGVGIRASDPLSCTPPAAVLYPTDIEVIRARQMSVRVDFFQNVSIYLLKNFIYGKRLWIHDLRGLLLQADDETVGEYQKWGSEPSNG